MLSDSLPAGDPLPWTHRVRSARRGATLRVHAAALFHLHWTTHQRLNSEVAETKEEDFEGSRSTRGSLRQLASASGGARTTTTRFSREAILRAAARKQLGVRRTAGAARRVGLKWHRDGNVVWNASRGGISHRRDLAQGRDRSDRPRIHGCSGPRATGRADAGNGGTLTNSVNPLQRAS